MTTIKITPHQSQEGHSAALIIASIYINWATKNDIGSLLTWCINGYWLLELLTKNRKLLKETGAHRLCRISPFDPQKRRYTTFTEVSVNDKEKDDVVRSYVFHPVPSANNLINKKKTDKLFEVLGGQLELIW